MLLSPTSLVILTDEDRNCNERKIFSKNCDIMGAFEMRRQYSYGK